MATTTTPIPDPMLYAQLNKIDTDILKTSYEGVSSVLNDAEKKSLADENRQHRNVQHILDNNNRNFDVTNGHISGKSQQILQDNNRNFDFTNAYVNSKAQQILDNTNRNSDFTNAYINSKAQQMLDNTNRNADTSNGYINDRAQQIIQDVNRNNDFTNTFMNNRTQSLSDNNNRNFDTTNKYISDRAQQIVDNTNQNAQHVLGTVTDRAMQNLGAINGAQEILGNAIDRSGTANLMATANSVTEQHRLMNENTLNFKEVTSRFGDLDYKLATSTAGISSNIQATEGRLFKEYTHGIQGLTRDAFQNELRSTDNFAKLTGDVYKAEQMTQKQGVDLYVQSANKAGEYFNRTQADILHTQKQNVELSGKMQMDLYKVENSLGRLADNHFERTQHSINESKAALQLQAAQNAATIQIEALKNKGELEKSMAECCCEIKTKIGDSTSALKDLINHTSNSDIRQHLSRYETKTDILKYARRRSRSRSRSRERGDGFERGLDRGFAYGSSDRGRGRGEGGN
jgi:hypothetical protein